MSVLSFPAVGAAPRPVEADIDNTARGRPPRLESSWSIGRNENCLALTEPAEFEEWVGELQFL
jgi:hypothetical protein